MASLETVSVPDWLPVPVGANDTCIVQLLPGPTTKPQLPPVTTENGFDALAVMLNIGALPVFFSVTVPTEL
jgi:hypothetical protein